MKKSKSSGITLSMNEVTISALVSEELSESVGCAQEFHFATSPFGKPKYICAICMKSFSDKNCLKKHIQRIHDLEPGPLLENNENVRNRVAPFKCRVCKTEFAYKRNLKRHLIKYHSQGLEDEEGGNCFCNVQGCKFRSFFINALRTHLTEEHEVHIDVEMKKFSSKKDFDQWKEEEEKTNVCLFIKEAGKHTLINGDQRLIYQCHRSGHYSGHGFGKRSFRVKGTCKLGKRCTAGIELTLKEEADVYEVVYYKTHIWHEPDVVHVNLSASERTYLANKLKEGASIASILESVKADKSVEGTNLCKRIHLLKRKDLVNIENTFRLNNTERHLRKQHKKGQKIDLAKIKKNVDDRGEIVSWILDSSVNEYEYFTVKKLQTQKCVENCGVVCGPCNACLHMYSCTCHDYLLFGTMCQHIHSVSASLCPRQTCEGQVPKRFPYGVNDVDGRNSGCIIISNNSSSRSVSNRSRSNSNTTPTTLTTNATTVTSAAGASTATTAYTIISSTSTTVTTPVVGETDICVTNSGAINSAAAVTSAVPRIPAASTAKKKRHRKGDSEAKQITNSDSIHQNEENFLTKNVQHHRARELQLERSRLKEKLDIFKHLCEPKIDEMDETSLQLLMKIVDSAMEIVNESSSTIGEILANNAEQRITQQSHTFIVQPTNLTNVYHHQNQHQHPQQQHDAVLHNPQTMPKQVINIDASAGPVPLQVLPSTADRKYELPSQYYATATTTMPNALVVAKKRRKSDELPPPILFKSSTTGAVTEKRPAYENTCNDHVLGPDNYTSFDCSLSWQTSALSAVNSSAGKWWT